MRLTIVLVGLAIALSGCFGGGGATQLSEEEARQTTEAAVSTFAESFAADGGDIKRITGSFEGSGEDAFAAFDFDMDIEWGQGGTMHVSLTAKTGGSTMAIEMYCDDESAVVVWGDEAYASRAGDQECMEGFGGETTDPLQFSELPEEMEGMDVTPNADGTVTATFSDDNGTYTLHIDRQGRLDRMDIDSDEVKGTMDIEYGTRGTVSVPQADERIPASVSGSGFFFDGAYEWSTSWSDTYPMDEFEVRVLDQADAVVATFPLADGATQEDGGFAFSFQDDGDGQFGGNDTFEVSSEAWTSSGDYDVVVWDLWADRDIEDNPIPGWGLAIMLTGLLAVGLRRRFT